MEYLELLVEGWKGLDGLATELTHAREHAVRHARVVTIKLVQPSLRLLNCYLLLV